MLSRLFVSLRARLGFLYGRSIYGALLLVVLGGLGVPAMIGSYVLVGVREQEAARVALQEALQRNADILALGMQESLWNMNTESAHSLVDSVMRDPSVLQVQVVGQADIQFMKVQSQRKQTGHVLRAERDVVMRGERIGHITLEMDDARSQQELAEKRTSYILVLAGQVLISALLIVLFLNARLMKPLRKLMRFSNRLSHGDFDTRLDLSGSDELGLLASQLDQMRVAIRRLFDDIGQREERFRTIVTQVPGAVFRCRPDGVIDFVSEAIEEISGYPAAQFMRGTTHEWTNLIVPEDRRRQRRAVTDAIESRQPYEVEYRIVDARGVERWVLENGQPQTHEDDPLPWVDGIISDVSQRKSNEMRIAALLAEQSAILDNVMFGVMFVRQRKIVSVNRRCEQLFGYEPGVLTGASTSILFADRFDYEASGIRQYRALSQGEYFSEERHYRRKDGSLLWCLVSGCALDKQHAEEGSIWVFADISERKESEEKLRLSATVIEHIADGVVVLDAKGLIVAVNPAFTQITGYSEAEALGKDHTLTRSGRHDAAFYESMWQEQVTQGFWRGEIWNRRKSGELYLEQLTVNAVRDSDGVTTHYVGVFSDITKAKESQEKLDHLAHHDPLTALPNRL
eukprot:gene8663-8474_t